VPTRASGPSTADDPVREPREPQAAGTEGHAGGLRVVVIDDHAVVRAGTVAILEDAGYDVVGEASSVAGGLEVVASTAPDLVVTDVRLPDGSGIELARRLGAEGTSSSARGALGTQRSKPRVVVLSAFDDPDYVRSALEAGVAGYLLKTMPTAELLQALAAAASGTTVLDPEAVRRLGERTVLGVPARPSALTAREAEVARLVAEGCSNRETAERLGISVRTVEGHLIRIFDKLGVRSRVELVRLMAGGGPPGASSGARAQGPERPTG
jgi:DNA-binding NarL/FixJ family response regulator